MQDPRDQPRLEGSCKLPAKAVGNNLYLVDIDLSELICDEQSRFLKELPHMYSVSHKKFGTKTRYKIFHGGTIRGGHLDSE